MPAIVEALEERRVLSSVPVIAAHLVWEQQPSSAEAGGKLPVVLALENANGTILTKDHAVVELRLTGGPKTILIANKRAKDGVLIFHDVRVEKAGIYQLEATSPDVPSVASNTFPIAPGTAVRMVFVGWELYGHSGDNAESFELMLVDRFGNVAVGDRSTISVLFAAYLSEGGFPVPEIQVGEITAGDAYGVVVEAGRPAIFVDSNPQIRPVHSPPLYIQIPPFGSAGASTETQRAH